MNVELQKQFDSIKGKNSQDIGKNGIGSGNGSGNGVNGYSLPDIV